MDSDKLQFRELSLSLHGTRFTVHGSGYTTLDTESKTPKLSSIFPVDNTGEGFRMNNAACRKRSQQIY